MINVTVWTENFQEREQQNVIDVYPKGIYGCIAEFLGKDEELNVRIATLDMPEQGLPDSLLNDTDVLIWWAHCKHDDVDCALADRIVKRVQSGMGAIFLHSAHLSKPFTRLLGTSGCLKWYEAEDVHERLWCVNRTHPIAKNVPECLTLPHEEMYGEGFDIAKPDDLIFIGWYNTGHVFRSGATWTRGRGKVFYFQPGHETYPIYYNPEIQNIVGNAVHWAAPLNGYAVPQCDHEGFLENK